MMASPAQRPPQITFKDPMTFPGEDGNSRHVFFISSGSRYKKRKLTVQLPLSVSLKYEDMMAYDRDNSDYMKYELILRVVSGQAEFYDTMQTVAGQIAEAFSANELDRKYSVDVSNAVPIMMSELYKSLQDAVIKVALPHKKLHPLVTVQATNGDDPSLKTIHVPPRWNAKLEPADENYLEDKIVGPLRDMAHFTMSVNVAHLYTDGNKLKMGLQLSHVIGHFDAPAEPMSPPALLRQTALDQPMDVTPLEAREQAAARQAEAAMLLTAST